jgi:hypothetical protein
VRAAEHHHEGELPSPQPSPAGRGEEEERAHMTHPVGSEREIDEAGVSERPTVLLLALIARNRYNRICLTISRPWFDASTGSVEGQGEMKRLLESAGTNANYE